MNVTVKTNQFVNAHGKQPRGTGQWFFFMGADDDVMNAFQFTGSFGQAKKAAVDEARKRGVATVHVGR